MEYDFASRCAYEHRKSIVQVFFPIFSFNNNTNLGTHELFTISATTNTTNDIFNPSTVWQVAVDSCTPAIVLHKNGKENIVGTQLLVQRAREQRRDAIHAKKRDFRMRIDARGIIFLGVCACYENLRNRCRRPGGYDLQIVHTGVGCFSGRNDGVDIIVQYVLIPKLITIIPKRWKYIIDFSQNHDGNVSFPTSRRNSNMCIDWPRNNASRMMKKKKPSGTRMYYKKSVRSAEQIF